MPTEDKPIRHIDLSCTFCGPGTWAVWEVVTDDGVVFVCDRHHVEMRRAGVIRFEKMTESDVWKKVSDNLLDFEDVNDYE